MTLHCTCIVRVNLVESTDIVVYLLFLPPHDYTGGEWNLICGTQS